MRIKQCIQVICFILSFGAVLSTAFTAEKKNIWQHNLEAYTDYAIKNNLKLKTYEAELRQLKAAEKLAYVIAKPHIGTVLKWDGKSKSRFQNAGIGISQEIPWYGKLKGQWKVARKESLSKKFGKHYYETIVVAKVRAAYVGLYTINKKIQLINETIDLLKYTESILLTKYENGRSGQVDILKTQMAIEKYRIDIVKFKDKAEEYRLQLEYYMNTPDARTFPFPDTVIALDVPPIEQDVRETAIFSNPEIKMYKEELTRKKLLVDLEKQKLVPDVNLEFEYHPAMVDGERKWSKFGEMELGIHFSMPVWIRDNKRKILEKEQGLRVEQVKYNEEKLFLETETADFLKRYEALTSEIESFKTVLIPKAEEISELINEEYKVGSRDITMLLKSRKDLLDLQFKMYDLIQQHDKMAAEIVICCLAQY